MLFTIPGDPYSDPCEEEASMLFSLRFDFSFV